MTRRQVLAVLLAAGLPDARTVSQRIAWLGFGLKRGDSAFFDVDVPDRGATYRVRVFAFDRKFGTTQN